MKITKITMDKLKVGSKLLSVKTKTIFMVTEVGDKIIIEDEQGDIRALAESTLKRWYKLIVDEVKEPEEEPQTQPEDVQVEEQMEVQVEEQMEAPIQPAVPKNVTRKAPNSQQADPVLVALRQRIIEEILSICPNAIQRETGSYTGLKVGKYNFAEIYKGKKRFSIRVMSKALSTDQLNLCSIAPKTYGWTLDATFTILVEDDFNTAIDLLKASYAYRLNNTPQRSNKNK